MVVSSQIDVLPAERRQVGEVSGFRLVSLLAQVIDHALQVNSVPQNDCGDEQVQAAGAMPLVFIQPVADLAETIEEYSTAKRILLLAFVEAYVTAPAQLGVLKPIKGKSVRSNLPSSRSARPFWQG